MTKATIVSDQAAPATVSAKNPGDSAIFLIAGILVLLAFVALALLPFDTTSTPEYTPTLFGP